MACQEFHSNYLCYKFNKTMIIPLVLAVVDPGFFEGGRGLT